MIDFRQAERQFQRLRAQYQRGDLEEAQYLVEVAKLSLRDAGGAFWMLDAETGTWFCNRGEGWTEAEPGAEAGAETPGAAPRRRAPRRLATLALLLVLLAAAAIGFLRWRGKALTIPEATATPSERVGVTIASPADGSRVALGQEVGIEAMLEVGSNLASTARAELRVDGEAIATQTVYTALRPGQSALPLSFPWRPKATGEHQVSVAVLASGGELLGQATIRLSVAENSAQRLPEPACTPDAAFLADVTIPPGTKSAPGARLQKVWQVRNSGTCAWGVDYELVRVAGDSLGTSDEVAVPPTAWGEAAYLEISLYAPEEPGTYASSWRLRTPGRAFFGPLLPLTITVELQVESGLPPRAPAGLEARLTEDGEAVRLAWQDRSEDEAAFRIYRQDVEASIGLVPANSQLFVDRSATCGHTYEYEVVAFNAAGSSAPAQSPPVTTTRCVAQDAPPTLVLTVVPTEVVASGIFTVVVRALDDVRMAQVLIRGEDTGDPALDRDHILACSGATCSASLPLTWSGETSATLTLVGVAQDSSGQESKPARVQVRIRPPR